MANLNRSRNSTAQEQRPHHQKGVDAIVDAIHRVAPRCSKRLSWSEVCRATRLSKGTAQIAFMSVSEAAFNASAAD